MKAKVKLPADIEALSKAINKPNPPTFEDLCNALRLSPRDCTALIERARAKGINVHVEHNHVGIARNYGVYDDRVFRLSMDNASGDEVRIAVISDTHFGSKYCMRDAVKDFIHKVHAEGIRHVFHPGDFLEGMYKHAFGELSHSGLEDQVADAIASLPHLPGLYYHCITGNHDETFAKASGLNIGRYITAAFRDAGRGDVRFYGDRGALIELADSGSLIELWHPLKGSGYAKDYPIRNHVAAASYLRKPHLLLIGHWHTYCHVYPRNVQAIACPTFQSGLTPYGRALGGAPSLGGLVLRWQMTEANTMRNFGVQWHQYHEHEMVQVAREVG